MIMNWLKLFHQSFTKEYFNYMITINIIWEGKMGSAPGKTLENLQVGGRPTHTRLKGKPPSTDLRSQRPHWRKTPGSLHWAKHAN